MLPQLETFFYPRLAVESNPEFKVKLGSHSFPEIDGQLIFESKQAFMCNMSLSIDNSVENNSPYDISLQIFARFKCDKPLDLKPNVDQFLPSQELHVLKTAVIGILVGGLREFVATITARQPWGPFILPTVDSNSIDLHAIFIGALKSKRGVRAKKRKAD